ncbi:serine hydrolase FSH [Hypoxylon crocopeplum]|nr:serine hydrolase FSH [Hypoxylon crocopeplum]
MRTLMLHGHSTSSFIFKAQSGPVRSKLGSSFQFDFIDGPYTCPPPKGLRLVLWKAYKWMETPGVDSIRRSVQWLLDHIEKNGPYDCICCFSKSSAVVAALILYHAREVASGSDKPLPFKSAIFINGSIEYSVLEDLGLPISEEAREIHSKTEDMVKAKVDAMSNLASSLVKPNGLWEDTSQLLHDPKALPPPSSCFGLDMTVFPPELVINIPTVHMYGGKDPICPSSIQLAYLCDPKKRVLYDHQGGHDVPRTPEVVADMVAMFKRLRRDIRSTAP